MDLDLLSQKIRESAVQAATVARSFQGFDGMAASDTYIHSEDLNVKHRGVNGNGNSSNQVNGIGRINVRTTPTEPQNRKADDSSSSIRSCPPQYRMQVVPGGAYNSAPIISPSYGNKATTTKHQQQVASLSKIQQTLTCILDGPDDNRSSVSDDIDDDDDDDDENDPILKMVRSDKAGISKPGSTSQRNPTRSMPGHSPTTQQQLTTIRHSSVKRPNVLPFEFDELDPASSSSSNHRQQKTNVNRFIEDLENRISLPNDNISAQGLTSTAGLADEESSSSTAAQIESPEATRSAIFPWMAVALSSLKIPTTTTNPPKRMVAPLTRNRPKVAAVSSSRFIEGEDDFPVSVSSSSAILDDEEMQTLNQFKVQQEQHQQPLTVKVGLWQYFRSCVQKHPRELLILLTLVLGAGAFYASRRFTAEDGVT